jgi:hypothetical protein
MARLCPPSPRKVARRAERRKAARRRAVKPSCNTKGPIKALKGSGVMPTQTDINRALAFYRDCHSLLVSCDLHTYKDAVESADRCEDLPNYLLDLAMQHIYAGSNDEDKLVAI